MINFFEENEKQGVRGQHGTYFKLNQSIGIKVINSHVFTTPIKAFRSKAYRRASIESQLLTDAFESGVVPQCFGVTLVRVKGGYRVGVLMQHLGNKVLSNSEFYDDAEIFYSISDSLKELGIFHRDLHEDNIMVYRGKYYAIDFSPECITIKE